MLTSQALAPSAQSDSVNQVSPSVPPQLKSFCETVEQSLETGLTLLDLSTDTVIQGATHEIPALPSDWFDLCRQVANRGRPEFIAADEPLLALAIPIAGGDGRHVAIGLFLSELFNGGDQSDRVARVLGWTTAEVDAWAGHQTPWRPSRLMSLAEAASSRLAAEIRVQAITAEDREMSASIATMYEEISLLHRLTQHLRITESEEDLGRLALDWLGETVPAESFALTLIPADGAGGSTQGRIRTVFLTHGTGGVGETMFQSLIDELGLAADQRSIVINSPASTDLRFRFPSIREAVIVPLTDKQRLVGWLGAFGHRNGGEFGSPEANLLGSVAAILAVHASNARLYREQGEFLANVVRALTSAIDAKDPYTCGHSDRVGRIAVALATELGCNQKQLDTLYLSGLLHDIGKIGINDSVLRKSTRLTEPEYEHIKLHTEIGYKILCDLTQLGEVLPVVRHHHEAWDGTGYPAGLAGEQIPELARIVAVADAFDAMSSDRSYRRGMADERLDEILRKGSGTQWDPEVISAFFRIRDQLRQMIKREPTAEPVDEEVRLLT
jgi:HD-GYP domain-containing protein (c-di-GMP phosphodiesterase class II)